MTNTALVVGASGIVGSNLARHLSDRGWQVLGLARRPPSGLDGVRPIAADLQDPASLRDILASLRPTHVFLATWLRQPTEAENIRVNAAMVRNVLEALSGADTLSHVALVTGLKHYLGPFESYGKGRLPATPFWRSGRGHRRSGRYRSGTRISARGAPRAEPRRLPPG